ncbi:riboflavin synthase [Flavihumibacter stibioxidans]|uniref:Riboflavin synthase n=1 Tax=Flavihumibacter stibioxidans TaxID=1834163 RepID=A0ABR7M5A0_9BACT|nr:riboflavin synthase [Flavihumibacter stibioxidans]MBC6490185.1 riboflavin synthase subunit alpha [Flavihumibacter stibioxidans]
MFTGIIEAMGTITRIEDSGTNRIFWLESPISQELSIDQSVSHDGVCLTIDAIEPGKHRVTAIAETLLKTNLSQWAEGNLVNLERSMLMNGRLDGHIVQGHVDCTAICISRHDKNGSWEYRFSIPAEFAALIIEKGSITINGTSLTLYDITDTEFSVSIIPYTFENTDIQKVFPGSAVNIEFDIIGKYIRRLKQFE